MITIMAYKKTSIIGTTYYDLIRNDDIYYGRSDSPYEWCIENLVKNSYVLILK